MKYKNMIIGKTTTLLEGIQAAKKEKYTVELLYSGKKIRTRQGGINYEKDECQLDEYTRYDGMSDPTDISMLFLISCKDGTKGFLSSGYGSDANIELIEFVLSLTKKIV